MRYGKFIQPDTCIPGNVYYLESKDSNMRKRFRSVKFVDYRPHPAEVIVLDGSKTKVIRRIDLFQRNGENGKIEID